jgi:uridine phosphorylase
MQTSSQQRPLPPSELILNDRGAVYHLDLRPEELADTVITVGDPDRVERVSRHFDNVEVRRQHREFVTHTGRLAGRRLTVVSTGIGTDNIDIVLNELDAVANIDLERRVLRDSLRRLDIIRIGTSGSLQADIPVDAFVASSHGIGIDNLMHFYAYELNAEELQVRQAFLRHTRLGEPFALPFVKGGSPGLLKHFTAGFTHGMTVTCPGFYGPQGRVLRLPLSQPGLNDLLGSFSYGNLRITNYEMETSAIYGIGQLLGHRTVSLSAIVANRVDGSFSADGGAAVDRLILTVLDILAGRS